MEKMERRYCNSCKKWVSVDEGKRCPDCHSATLKTRSITDPEEIRKIIEVRESFKVFEDEIVKMIAESGALLEGHFILGED